MTEVLELGFWLGLGLYASATACLLLWLLFLLGRLLVRALCRSSHRKPARTVSPGQVIERELKARGWTQEHLACFMRTSEQTVNEIVQGRQQITGGIALQLADAFGTSVMFWLNLESANEKPVGD